jgi:hypothetical protein
VDEVQVLADAEIYFLKIPYSGSEVGSRRMREVAMAQVVTALVILALCDQCHCAKAGATYVGWADGKRYTVTITNERLNSTPSWRPEADNPPLSARKAMEISMAFKKDLLRNSPNKTWRLESLALAANEQGSSKERWYWVAYFGVQRELSAGGGGRTDLYVVVLRGWQKTGANKSRV